MPASWNYEKSRRRTDIACVVLLSLPIVWLVGGFLVWVYWFV